MKCPNCSKNGVTKNYWIYAWPLKTACSFCGVKIRPYLRFAHNLLAQIIGLTILYSVFLGFIEFGLFVSLGIGGVIGITISLLIAKKLSKPVVID
jgi:hypothetical protein